MGLGMNLLSKATRAIGKGVAKEVVANATTKGLIKAQETVIYTEKKANQKKECLQKKSFSHLRPINA